MIGKTLAHYEITAHLGTGGMGEVYRAQDTKLRRDVALKLLPPEFAADPSRMARFEQEARALAALNHTNISGIFGIEQHEDLKFLVMELAEGEDLSDIIKRGPLPVDEAVDIARQICTGLEDAHGRGIVHRDLKPANIKVLPDGTVKILDFGLAKALVDDPGASSTDIANSPTMMNTMTQPGVLLGTAAYMSPEQARGKAVDWRADIWAFGCVFYEMLCGSQVYGRPTVTDILAAIIEREPDFSKLPAGLPPALKNLLRRTLVKDQRDRLQAIGDARIVLQEFQGGGAEETEETTTRSRMPWMVTILAAVLLTAAGTWFLKGTPPAAPEKIETAVMRLSLDLPAEYPLHFVGGSLLGSEYPAFDLSADGSCLVYLTRTDGFRGLVAHDLATGIFRPLTGTDNAFLPHFSPDGAWVAFFADGHLKRVPYAGGGVEILASAFDPTGLLWSQDGDIYWITRQGAILNRMKPALGAAVETVLNPCISRMVEDWVEPGALLLKIDNRFTALLPDGSRQPLDLRGGHARLFDKRYMLATQSGRLVASPLEGDGSGPLSAPRTVLTGLRTTPYTGRAQYAVSDNGLLAYVSGPPADVAQLVRRYPDGREEQLPFKPKIFGAMDVLPDGSRIAIEIYDDATERTLVVLDLETGTSQVIGDDTRYSQPIWSGDGTGLTLTTLVDSTYVVMDYPLDSVASPTVLFSSQSPLFPWDWSSDGNLLVVTERDPENRADATMLVWDRRTESFTPQAKPVTGYIWSPSMSPDNRFIAYTQVGDAGSEVYVVPYPATGKRWLVSAGSGEEPLWLENSKELVFRRGQGWYKVAYDDTGDFRASAPELMFEGRYINIGGMEYRVLADGSLMLMVSANTQDMVDHLDIVVNWDQELARVLGAGVD